MKMNAGATGSDRRSSGQGRTRRAVAEALEGRLLLSSVPDNQNQTPTGWAWYTGVDANTLSGAVNQGYRIVDLSVTQASQPEQRQAHRPEVVRR